MGDPPQSQHWVRMSPGSSLPVPIVFHLRGLGIGKLKKRGDSCDHPTLCHYHMPTQRYLLPCHSGSELAFIAWDSPAFSLALRHWVSCLRGILCPPTMTTTGPSLGFRAHAQPRKVMPLQSGHLVLYRPSVSTCW